MTTINITLGYTQVFREVWIRNTESANNKDPLWVWVVSLYFQSWKDIFGFWQMQKKQHIIKEKTDKLDKSKIK